MKIVKLDNRHRAFKHGFTHAIRFGKGESTDNFYKIRTYLEEKYPRPIKQFTYSWEPGYYLQYAGKWEIVIGHGAWRRRTSWICVRNEALLTMILLSIDDIT